MILSTSHICTKPFKNPSELLDILEKRGLFIENKEFAISFISNIGYYRLSGYFVPFYESKNFFKANTTFNDIYKLYEFDKELRNIIFKFLEKIEITLRARISSTHARYFGAFGYLQNENSLNRYIKLFDEFMSKIKLEKSRSNEVFIKHIREKYNSDELPIWALVEILSFGTLSKLYALLPKNLKKEVAGAFNEKLDIKVFENWLLGLTVLRNACAHHTRIWNKSFTLSFKYPKKMKEFLSPNVKTNQIFFALSVILALLKDTGLKDEILVLFKKYPQIDKSKMGFLADYQMLYPWSECR